jgi:uncharacterized protein (DUF488 family)
VRRDTPDLFTIGYEACTLERVLQVIVDAGVTHLVDIRALPQSRKPGFSKRQLAAAVEEAGLRYSHLRGLGTPKAGRDAVRRGDVGRMHVVFNAHMQTGEAQADLPAAVAIATTDRACLLCFERDHTTCHRSIVAGLVHSQTGQQIRYLLPLPASSGCERCGLA